MRHKRDVIYQLMFKNGKPTEFYRTLKNIYTYHTRDEIGCLVGHLYEAGIAPATPFENKRVKINVVEIR
ncbi:hypothetical protein [Emticicia sp. 17c]|uniref:hypothetical protein n=1 Tax=Emticicia sp. 17c TaxID=3127704 RepID=UPI00301E35FC